MNWLMEKLLGLPSGFFSREGEVSVGFEPVWPWQEVVGASVWNVVILGLLGWLVVWVYRREGGGTGGKRKVILGVMRGLLVGLVVFLLNRPVLTLTQNRVEPSVVAVMVDQSLSMKVRDLGGAGGNRSRLEGVLSVLGTNEAGLLRELARQHTVRVYGFDREVRNIGEVRRGEGGSGGVVLPEGLRAIEPMGQATALGLAVERVVSELSGQRLAGVVILTDGRETPARGMGEVVGRLREFAGGAGVKVFPVEFGSADAPRNLAIDNVVVQDSAFKGDMVTVKATVRATGYAGTDRFRVKLVDGKTNRPLPGLTGPAETQVTLEEGKPQEVELPLKPEEIGDLQLAVVIEQVGGSGAATRAVGDGEVDDLDNTRTAHIAVLDNKVKLLYVEGYPRWDYRFLRTEMIRDQTVDVSILLTSSDEDFPQDGDIPIRRFPESIEELLTYDVVLVGDVDPRQFTDAQLAMLSDFVLKKGGGLAMVAGPRYSPVGYKNTALEPLLPVNISAVTRDLISTGGDLVQGFRPVVTTVGLNSGIFRFLPDRAANENYLRNDWQRVFWYLRGVTVKPGAGEVYAEHPTDLGPDGKKAPILVAGRYGAGRTLFSSIDDSWRWRYYTGESVFDTYWVQQIRLLARGRKLGQRLYALSTNRSVYELGERVTATLRILDSTLIRQLPERVEIDLLDGEGKLVRKEGLTRMEDRPDTFVGSFQADRLGRGAIQTPFLAPGVNPGESGAVAVGYEVVAPRLELADARVDKGALEMLARETGGRVFTAESTGELPAQVQSVAKVIPVESSVALWGAPIAMALFVLLITAEWVARKLFGMV